jgi:hypothetical protein
MNFVNGRKFNCQILSSAQVVITLIIAQAIAPDWLSTICNWLITPAPMLVIETSYNNLQLNDWKIYLVSTTKGWLKFGGCFGKIWDKNRPT